jgi:excisionase family DNA binding protein
MCVKKSGARQPAARANNKKVSVETTMPVLKFQSTPPPPPSPGAPALPSPLLVDSREAARLLGISERTLWELAKNGSIPFLRVNKRLKRFRIKDVENYVARG